MKKQCLITKRIADDLDVPQGQPVYVFKGIRHMINSKSRASYKAYTSELIGREISIKPIESQLLYLEVEKISREPIMSAKKLIHLICPQAYTKLMENHDLPVWEQNNKLKMMVEYSRAGNDEKI